MDIRPACIDDLEALARLVIGFRNHLERTSPSDLRFRDNIARLLQSEDAQFFIAAAEGVPLGYVLLRFRHSMWADGLEATLEDLFVDPEHRSHGTGAQLVGQALAHARQRGCVTACLDTNEHNAASNRIYARLGFECHSRRWQGRQVFYRLDLTQGKAPGQA